MKQTIQEYLGVPSNWKVKKTIKHEIVLMPNEEDIRNATPSDPRGCALKNTACRVFDIPNAAIGARCSYIPQRDSKGRWYIARMYTGKDTARAIQLFDKTGTMPKGGFRFTPLTKSQHFKTQRDYAKKRRLGEVGNNSKPRTVKPRRVHTRAVKTRTIPMNIRTAA